MFVEKKNTEKQKIVLTSLILMTALLQGCTSKVPFEALPVETKVNVVEKSLLDLDGQYLYSSSQQSSSRSAAEAFPFLSGENKRVRLQLKEKTIDVIEEEKDARFRGNVLNNKLVLQIPVEHVQFQCAKNSFGECTNKEEAATDIPWEQRNSVKVQYDGVVSAELQLLPLLDSAEFGDNCYVPISSRLKSAAIEKNAINIQIERTFKTAIKAGCLPGEIEGLSDFTISAVYHYSMVKLDSILSKDYETISYPSGSLDEQTFGIFASNSIKLDVDNNNTDRSERQIMNRWNPNRKEITYYLSDEFAKEENKQLRDLTKQTVDGLNKSLAEANLKFRINLKDAAGRVPGDIRNSMIVLVEDPVAASVIGYGPQTEDPVTGEIVSARTVMFLGTIKKFVKYTYDEIIREKALAKSIQKSGEPKLKLSQELVESVAKLKSSKLISTFTSIRPQLDSILKTEESGPAQTVLATAANSSKNALQSQARGTSGSLIEPIQSTDRVKRMKAEVFGDNKRKNDDFIKNDYKSRMKYLHEAKNCAFAPAMDGAGSISSRLASAFADDAKPWVELNESEKEQAIAIILPEVYVPTLIHELGHNMGLRHNFKASEDKPNFYSKEELAQIGVEHSIPFSSVMDYGNDLKTLPVFGKYDLAALRFAYNREVDIQVNANEVVRAKVTTTLADLMGEVEAAAVAAKQEVPELVPYGFCTDENVGINAGCKRFDLGTTSTEIVANMIQDYEEWYQHRNLRDGRSNMSLMDDLSYARRINMIFKDLRIMMEVRERIADRFNIPADAEEWETIPFLQDLKQATVLGGQFLTRVLLVPDHLCAFSLKEDPTTVIAILPLSNFGEGLVNCRKVRIPEQFMVVAEAGKSFNSKKDADSSNSYLDQIDVRGIWIDKILAAQQLLSRQIGIFSFDTGVDSYLNIPEVRGDLEAAIKGLMMDTVVAPVEFRLVGGGRVELEMKIDLSDSQVIAKALSPATARNMGLNVNSITPLAQVVASKVSAHAPDKSRKHDGDIAVAQSVQVMRMSPSEERNLAKGTPIVDIDGVRHVALPANKIALEAIKNLNATLILEKVTSEELLEILKLRSERGQRNAPKDASKQVKQAWTLDSEVIQDYLDEVIKSSDFYKGLLINLPTTPQVGA